MMSQLARIIMHLYPHARPAQDWYLAEVRGADGEPVVQIAHWDEQAIGSPKPNEQELLAQADTVILEQAKAAKIEAIDARSEYLLTAGLEVADGAVISTSEAAQRNLLMLSVGVQMGSITLPQGVSTVDGGEYVITDANDLKRIQDLWTQRMTSVLDAGRALRQQVIAAATVDEVDAIVDARE